MNNEQWTSLIRIVLSLLLGPSSYLIMKGVLSQDQANQLIPVLVPLIMVVGGGLIGKWGHSSNSAAAITAAVNSSSVPGVKAVASSSPSPAVGVDPSTGTVKPLTPQGTPVALIAALGVVVSLGMLLGSHEDAYATGVKLPIDPLHLNSVTSAATPITGPGAVVGDLISKGLIPKIVSDMQSLDSVAGAVNPKDTTDAAPYNTYLPEAHLCIEQAIPWLQNLPTMATIPTPTGDGGVLTTIGMLEIQSDNLQAFLSSLSINGFPKNVKIPCAAWAVRVAASPMTLANNASKDVMNFITLFSH